VNRIKVSFSFFPPFSDDAARARCHGAAPRLVLHTRLSLAVCTVLSVAPLKCHCRRRAATHSTPDPLFRGCEVSHEVTRLPARTTCCCCCCYLLLASTVCCCCCLFCVICFRWEGSHSLQPARARPYCTGFPVKPCVHQPLCTFCLPVSLPSSPCILFARARARRASGKLPLRSGIRF
jgi:hypothetical protein